MTCRTGCPTQDCGSYADCLRGMGLRVAYANSANGWDATKQKRWDRENASYRQAVKDGLNPSGVSFNAVNTAYDAASKG